MSDSPIGKVGNRRELFDFLSVDLSCGLGGPTFVAPGESFLLFMK